MKKIRITLLILLVTGLHACENNEPANYTSIRGSWRCTETDPTNTRTYPVDFYRTKADTTIYLLSNFYNVSIDSDFDITTKLSGKNLSINPVPQVIGSTQYVIKSGSGVINNTFTRIDFNYIIFDGKSDIPVKVTFTR